ncbi:MAG: hypothetical protein ACRCS8_00675, partial [Brevinema sp.]
EEKGIAYAGGYIAGDIIIDLLITKGLDKFKAIKTAKLSDEAVEAGSLVDEIVEAGEAAEKSKTLEKIDELNPGVVDDIIEGTGKVELNDPTKVKTNKGIEVEFTNPSGNTIKYVEQNSKNIPNAIESAKNSSNVGKAIEGKVGNFVQQKTEVTGFGLEVLNSSGGKVTDLDVVTKSQIIEVKKSASSLKIDQIDRLIDQTNPQFFNFENKEVIIYIEESIEGITNPKTLEKIQYIQEKGIKIVNSLDELEGVIK